MASARTSHPLHTVKTALLLLCLSLAFASGGVGLPVALEFDCPVTCPPDVSCDAEDGVAPAYPAQFSLI